MNKPEKIKTIQLLLNRLSDFQLENIKGLSEILIKDFSNIYYSKESDFASEAFVRSFGDILRIHHYFSREPFTKDKFEHALERTLNYCGIKSKLAPRGHSGYDIIINGKRVSLKTQADKSIKRDSIHISKFMELGKGAWDLKEQLQRFIEHMNDYQRIFSLRCFTLPDSFEYELVEIPMDLLKEAIHGDLYMMDKSTQDPKPGYCDVKDGDGVIKFRLYFDAGTERKLQIKNLKTKYCKIHAFWTLNQ